MADDITLTVRVRDLSRGDLGRLQRQLNGMQRELHAASRSSLTMGRNTRLLNRDLAGVSARFNEIIRTGRLTSREFNALSQDMNLISRGMRRARNEGELTRRQFRNMNRDLQQMHARLVLLGRQGNVFDRLAARATLFQGRMREVSSTATGLRRRLASMGEGGASGLRTTLLATSALIGAMRRLGAIINLNKRWTAILIATLLLIGPAAQALGVLLVTALGGAFLALGAFALRSEKDVRSAFNRMKGTVGSSVREAAQPMREHLVAAMDEVGVSVQRMQPALTGAFRAVGPLIDDLVGAFTDFAGAALPGFTRAMSNAGPAMSGFRQAMTLIGDGLGEMFSVMTEGSAGEALKQVWIDLGTELRNLLVSLGEFISTASQSGTATMIMVGLFRILTGILNLVAGALEALDPLFDIVAAGFRKLANVPGMDKMAAPFDASGKSLKSLRKELVAAEREIRRIKDDQDWAEGIPGPAADLELERMKSTEEDLAKAQQRRKDLLGAIADAEARAAGETAKHADTVSRLTENLQTLADLNRGYLDAQAAQFEALNKAKEEMGEYKDALKFTNGALDLTSTAAQEAYKLISDLGRVTGETTAKAIAADAPWEKVRSNWQSSYDDIVRLGDGMGLTAEQARIVADMVVGIPPTKEVWIQARTEQAKSDIEGVIAAFEAAPDSHAVTVETLTADAKAALEDFGFKITNLPDGKTKVETANGQALGAVAALYSALRAIDGYVATTRTRHYVDTLYSKAYQDHRAGERAYTNKSASGGLLRRYADGGAIQHFPSGGYVQGPGGPTSDSILATFGSGATAAVSDTEYVVKAQAVRKYGVSMMDDLNAGRLPVARLAGGGPTKAQEARKELAKSFGISHFGRRAGYRRDPFEKGLGAPESLSALVSSLNQLRNQIKKVFSGGKESSLLKQLDKWGKSLIKWQKQLRDVEKSLEKAKDKLKSLKDAASQFDDSVKGGIISGANITRAATAEDSRVTINTLLSQARGDSAQALEFDKALNALKKKGVSGRIIEQLAEAGIQGGGLETAQALLGADKGQIKELNTLNQSIRQSADNVGEFAADALYGAGIKAAEGLVAGLKKKEKQLEDQMLKLAKSMEKALKKALGIKSPSQVMMRVGALTAEGFALGVQKNRQQWKSPENLLGISTGSASTTPGAVHAGPPRGAGQADRPIVVQIAIAGRDLGEIVIDPLRRAINHRGGNVQAALGS